MRRAILKSVILSALVVTSLLGAPFWGSKPYTEWTEKEVEKLLGDSPWVRAANVSLDFAKIPRGGATGGPGGVGRSGGDISAPRGEMGRPGGGMQMPNAYVMWQSAMTVRRAMLRAAQLRESPAAEGLQKQLETKPTHHILAVMGLQTAGGPAMARRQRPETQNAPEPAQLMAMRERMEAQMKENTTLTIDGQKLSPEKMETVVNGGERIVMFYFPREVEFSTKSKALLFQTQMGPMKISAEFKAKEMAE